MSDIFLANIERFLGIARRGGAEELRLMSGRTPMIVAGGAGRFVDGPELSATMIRDLHQACLALAESEIDEPGATFAYRMASARLGTVRCAYTLRGKARSLSLFPEEGAPETIDSKDNRRPPVLRAEAKLERKARD